LRKRADLVGDAEERAAFLEECGADFCFGTPSERTAPTVPRVAAPRPAGTVRTPAAAAPARRPPGRPPLPRAAAPVPSPTPPAATFASFQDLEAAVRICTRCPLCRLRTQAVPGEGNLKTELMFVGEAPGRDEDAQGRPFVGRAGQLLRRIITNAMHFREDEVYITNVIKCRPPENRVPARDEIEACSPYLVQQIALIKPRVIVTLGKTPADFFIPSRRPMGDLRGNFFEYLGIPLMPTFHPSYLVRNEGNQELKRMVWEDMKKVLARLGRT
jgi:uracil-DNA glycosylase family 4